MNIPGLINKRMANQQLSEPHHSTIKKLVSYMGALQAQDFAMSKWAIGLRMNAITESAVEAAINKGDIIRTHALRPTWHLVAADDVYWMLELTAPAIKARMKTNDKKLEITEALYKKTNKIIEKALEKSQLSRDELMQELEKKKIVITENRSSHFLMHAELDGIICSGKVNNNKHSYALLSERVKMKKAFTKEEALHELAVRYFQSHGPAKVSDFMWWSGLTGKAAANAVATFGKSFIKESFRKETYWLKSDAKPAINKNKIALLPAYDEYIISYNDRNAIVENEAAKKVISSNGIFWPVILINGKVAGKWSRKITNDEVKINADFFASVPASIKTKFKKQALAYAKFLNKKLVD